MPRNNPKSAPRTPAAVAQSSELPPPPPTPEIQQIPLRGITASLYQPRRFPVPDAENPKLLDLARSIRAKGVIQPILVRPVESGHEIVVGECRVRASLLDLPELAAIGPLPLYVPAIVRELSDTEAAELTVEENIRRQDLHPLEEAAGVHTLLLLHNGNAMAVAARLGQTPAWVACRARIHSHLSEAWKELLSDPENPMWFWTADHIEEIAKLAPEVQDEILANFTQGMDLNITVPELRRFLADLTRKLSRAPFPLDDETLHPSAGACTNCPLTTLAAPLLFTEQGDDAPADIKEARCLNRTCWNQKCQRSAERTAAKLRSEHPDLLLVSPGNVPFEEIPASFRSEGLLQPHAYDKVKKNAEDAQPAMVAGGPQTGRLIWIKPSYPPRPTRIQQPDSAASDPASPETVAAPSGDVLAERRTRHMNRRIARMAELTKDLLQACDGRALSVQILVSLARVFGTNHNRKGVWTYSSASDAWADFDAFLKLSAEEAASDIWTSQLQPVLASRLQYCGPTDAARLHREIVATLTLIGASYPDLYRGVAKELPEPKAWAKLPGYEPENPEGEPPAPLANVLAFESQDDPAAEDEETRLQAISA